MNIVSTNRLRSRHQWTFLVQKIASQLLIYTRLDTRAACWSPPAFAEFSTAHTCPSALQPCSIHICVARANFIRWLLHDHRCLPGTDFCIYRNAKSISAEGLQAFSLFSWHECTWIELKDSTVLLWWIYYYPNEWKLQIFMPHDCTVL